MAFRNPILAGTTLVRDAIQSSNYLAGYAGWQIATNGTAEFNTVTIRGASIVGADQLWYNGTPAAGNLAFSLSEAGGTDTYGNTYPSGFTAFNLAIPGSDVRVDSGNVYYGPANTAGLVAATYTGDGGLSLTHNSGQNSAPATDTASTLVLAPGKAGGASGGAAPRITFGSGAPGTPVDIALHLGNLFAADSVGTLKDWTPATLTAGLTAGGGAGMLAGLQTRELGVAGLVAVTGGAVAGAALASSTVIATGLPPTASARAYFVCGNNVSAGGGGFSNPMVFVDSTGQATYYGANLPAGAQLYFAGVYPTIGV